MPDEAKGKEGTSTERTTSNTGWTFTAKDSPGHSTERYFGSSGDSTHLEHYTEHSDGSAHVTDTQGHSHSTSDGGDSGGGDGGSGK